MTGYDLRQLNILLNDAKDVLTFDPPRIDVAIQRVELVLKTLKETRDDM